MDYTDEAAVWAMLTAPMTVVKGDGRTQVRIRKEPDSKSAAIGILTRATQGVRIMRLSDGARVISVALTDRSESEDAATAGEPEA